MLRATLHILRQSQHREINYTTTLTFYSKTCLKRNAIVPVFFSVFTGFRFTKGCVLIKQSTKNMIPYDYNEGII